MILGGGSLDDTLFDCLRRRRARLRGGDRRTNRANPATADDALVKKARGIHERVIALDTHDDISPADFTPERNYTQDLGNQVNLPKMVAGGLDASFFIVYVGQGPLTPEGFDDAYKQAIAKFDAVHRLTEKIAPDKIELALTAADVRRINKAGKKVALIGVENGYPLGDASTAVKRVKEFYDRGARYLSLAHNGHSQLADSNNGEASGVWAHNGLSELGKQVIAELNRVGIMVDLSHPSKPANMQAIALSKAPVIASHSSARACATTAATWTTSCCWRSRRTAASSRPSPSRPTSRRRPRRRPNGRQRSPSSKRNSDLPARQPRTRRARRRPGTRRGRRWRCAWRGGTCAGRPLTCPAAQVRAAGADAAARWRSYPTTSAPRRQKRLAEIDKQFPPPPRANVKDFVDHIDYIVKKIGIDHVGISSDFDGGGGIDGWNDASETFNVTLELVRRGYTERRLPRSGAGTCCE